MSRPDRESFRAIVARTGGLPQNWLERRPSGRRKLAIGSPQGLGWSRVGYVNQDCQLALCGDRSRCAGLQGTFGSSGCALRARKSGSKPTARSLRVLYHPNRNRLYASHLTASKRLNCFGVGSYDRPYSLTKSSYPCHAIAFQYDLLVTLTYSVKSTCS